MNIGIFPGSFNPVHCGHVMLAQQAIREFCLDRMMIIPVFCPPHKSSADLATYDDRIAMCRQAFAHIQNVTVSEMERELPVPSYSCNTIMAIKSIFPKDCLYLLIGEDQLNHFGKWKDNQVILDSTKLILAKRKTNENRRIDFPYSKLKNEYFDISGSEIRCKKLFFPPYLPEKVSLYINQHHLYEEPT